MEGGGHSNARGLISARLSSVNKKSREIRLGQLPGRVRLAHGVRKENRALSREVCASSQTRRERGWAWLSVKEREGRGRTGLGRAWELGRCGWTGPRPRGEGESELGLSLGPKHGGESLPLCFVLIFFLLPSLFQSHFKNNLKIILKIV